MRKTEPASIIRRALRPIAVLTTMMAMLGCEASPPADACTARYAVSRRRPEVIVVLDRSCAMRAQLAAPEVMATGPTDTEGRWGAVTAALGEAVSASPATGWGLVMLPADTTDCGIESLDVDPSPGSGAAMMAALASAGADPFSVCDLGVSEVPLEAALSELFDSETVGSTGLPLVLVIAAGAPSCGSTSESLRSIASDLGYEVAVVALSPDETAAPMLRSLAPESAYHEVSSRSALDIAIADAIEGAADCMLDIETSDSPSADDLHVWVDGALVPADPDEGFSYSAGDGAIALNGLFCERLRAGEVSRVDAAVGCEVNDCVAGSETCDGLDNDCDDSVDEGC